MRHLTSVRHPVKYAPKMHYSPQGYRHSDWRLYDSSLRNKNGPHYVNLYFNCKNTSHLQFLQKLFIHNVCKLVKKKSMWDAWDIFNNLFWIFFSWERKNAPFETLLVGKEGYCTCATITCSWFETALVLYIRSELYKKSSLKNVFGLQKWV